MPQPAAARPSVRPAASVSPPDASRSTRTAPTSRLLPLLYVPTYNREMAQVTVYLPDDVLAVARKSADAERKSLSGWVSALIQEATATEWPESFVTLLHQGSGDIVEPDDPPPGDLDLFR